MYECGDLLLPSVNTRRYGIAADSERSALRDLENPQLALSSAARRVEEIPKKRGKHAWLLTQVTAPIAGSMSIEKLEGLMSACQ